MGNSKWYYPYGVHAIEHGVEDLELSQLGARNHFGGNDMA
jgi:hypothetical protein